MRTLKSFEFPETSGAIKAKYDWKKLLDGGIYHLDEGKDFQSKPANFIMMARSRGKKLGFIVKATKVEGGVVLQAIKPPKAK